MDDVGRCPECGEDLTYDEVDIGVGIQRGNARCDECGWSSMELDIDIRDDEDDDDPLW